MSMASAVLGELRLRLSCLLRKAGLGRVPAPVLACMCTGLVLLLGVSLWHFWPSDIAVSTGEDFAIDAQQTGQELSPEDAQDGSGAGASVELAVDVEGAVKRPGLYRLQGDARIDDAVAAAGGFKKSAARGEVNLAQALSDGQQIYVPFKSASPEASPVGDAAENAGAAGQEASSGDKININTATAEELQKLSGVGESISARIIDYREKNGSFKSVDDLTEVSGIGDARLEAIRDQIRV